MADINIWGFALYFPPPPQFHNINEASPYQERSKLRQISIEQAAKDAAENHYKRRRLAEDSGSLDAGIGLHLLQRIDMEDLRFRPDDRLQIEIQRLEALERATIAA
jgi:hypothetical protein